MWKTGFIHFGDKSSSGRIPSNFILKHYHTAHAIKDCIYFSLNSGNP